MREILFRAKRMDSGEWIEGYYAIQSNHACFAHELKHQHFIFKDIFLDFNLGELQKFDVIPETVGQYTGLTDKNGKKIFEGDIVLVPYIDPIFKCTWNDTSPCERAIVKYCNGMFYVEYIESGDKFTLSAMDGCMKMIGNIYDNPELLGGNNNV